MEEDCILWGYSVLVPFKLQERVMQELHDHHPGVVWMKALARSHVWWPDIDKKKSRTRPRAVQLVKQTRTLHLKLLSTHGLGQLHTWNAYT